MMSSTLDVVVMKGYAYIIGFPTVLRVMLIAGGLAVLLMFAGMAAGENTTVNATWRDISTASSPTHQIIAIVNPLVDIGRYECKNVLRDRTIRTIPVVANVTEEITTLWQASTGSHTIRAEIASGIEEINATNNCADKLVSAKASRDFTVLNITYDPPDPDNGDFVVVNAEIANIGFRHADPVVEIWDLSERNLEIEANNFLKGYTRSWRIPGARTRTGIGAEMTGVHFESIDTTIPGDHSLYVYDASGAEIADYSYCKHDDLWVWGRGDFLTVSFRYRWGGHARGIPDRSVCAQKAA